MNKSDKKVILKKYRDNRKVSSIGYAKLESDANRDILRKDNLADARKWASHNTPF